MDPSDSKEGVKYALNNCRTANTRPGNTNLNVFRHNIRNMKEAQYQIIAVNGMLTLDKEYEVCLIYFF